MDLDSEEDNDDINEDAAESAEAELSMSRGNLFVDNI